MRFLIAGKFVDGIEPFEEYPATELRRGTIDNPAKWEIYANSRLTLNLFRDAETPADSPSPRVFEVTAFGHAALLTGGRREEVTRIFGYSVYEFDDAATVTESIERALADDEDRLSRVDRARQIALRSHTYEQRAAELLSQLREREHRRSVGSTAEERIAWIIGCGRTGSTWLAEMLGDLPGIRRWHEPYFGRLFRHVHDKPRDLERRSSFFAKPHRDVWLEGLREMFFKMVRARYPRFGEHGLVVKEVNTPELYGWLRALFPVGRVIFLKRDPFDVLDSYLDLQKPGSWNTEFGEGGDPLAEANVRRTAEHIATALWAAREACDLFADNARLEIAYEDLLDDPLPGLMACAELVDGPTTPEEAFQAIEKHRFQNYKKSGELEFRRQGKAGVWRQSANFTPEVTGIAGEILGPLRTRLGYSASDELAEMPRE